MGDLDLFGQGAEQQCESDEPEQREWVSAKLAPHQGYRGRGAPDNEPPSAYAEKEGSIA